MNNISKDLQEKIKSYINENKDNILKNLSSLVEKNTILDKETVDNEKPYGNGISEGFKFLSKVCKKNGSKSL